MRYLPGRHALLLAAGLVGSAGVAAALVAPRPALAAGEEKPIPEKAEKKERSGPASLADMERGARDMSREARADEKRTEAIEQLKLIIPKITDPSQKADMLFQLAELYWEKSKFIYFQEMEAWDAAYEAWLEETAAGAEKPEPQPDHSGSDVFRKEAVALYNQILEAYPSNPRNDEVLFNLAYNLYETGEKKDAVALYWELIKRYPSSPSVPDAYQQMGDHFFDSNDVFKAQKAYQKALETGAAAGDERVSTYARYKLAWCDYNLGEYRAALAKFDEVVQATEAAEARDASLRGRLPLKNEALRDMAQPYVMLQEVQPAIAYFEAHGGTDAHKWIARLANQYYQGGNGPEAIETYRHLIAAAPNHVEAPEYQARIVNAYHTMGERDAMLSEMARLVEVYGPNGPWAMANAENEQAVADAYRIAEKTQRQLVTDYHLEAQKTKYAETYRLAAEIYRRYLEKFDDSEHAYQLRYYYADILFTLQEYEDAAVQFLGVVDKDPDGKYTLDAAYNALLAYETLAGIARGDIRRNELSGKTKVDEGKDKGDVAREQILRRASKDDKAESIPQWEQKQIEASDAYVAVVDRWREKNGAELGKKKLAELEDQEIVVRYKAAYLLYNHRHYEEAAKRFESIILKWPGDAWAVTSANLILDSLNVREAWSQLNDLARKFRDNKKLMKGGGREFATLVDTLIEGSQFKVVQGIDASGDAMAAARGYIAFADEFPKSQYADTALYNAMAKYEAKKELDTAASLGARLMEGYPESDLQPRAVESLGRYHELMADYAKAAHFYQTYADRYLDEDGEWTRKITEGRKGERLERAKKMAAEVREHLPDNLFNAALWYEGLGQRERARAAYLRYVEAFKDRDDVPEVFHAVAVLHEQQEDWAEAAEAYLAYAKRYGAKVPAWKAYRARYRAATARERQGESKQAMALFKGLVADFPKLPADAKASPVVKDAAAHAAFRLLDDDFEAYEAVTFDTTNGREVQRRLQKKTVLLEKLVAKYTEVLGYGSGDWGVAALTRIGLGYQDFARNLLDAPIPPNLDEDQQELYRAFIEEKAFPLEDKAIVALEKALEKSYELSVYSDWTIRAQNVLLAFKPGAYGEIREPDFAGSEFFITADWEKVLAEEPVLVDPAPQAAPSGASAEQARR